MEEEYVKIGFGEQTRILTHIKEKSGLSWKETAEILGVHKRMLFFYLEEKNKLPLYRLKNLCQKTKICLADLGNFQTVKSPNYTQKKVRLHLMDENLAEFLGALSGDGNIDPNNHRILVGCDAITDFE